MSNARFGCEKSKCKQVNLSLLKWIEMADLKALADAIIKGDQKAAVQITKAALGEGTAAESVLNEGLITGMDVIGSRFT